MALARQEVTLLVMTQEANAHSVQHSSRNPARGSSDPDARVRSAVRR